MGSGSGLLVVVGDMRVGAVGVHPGEVGLEEAVDGGVHEDAVQDDPFP